MYNFKVSTKVRNKTKHIYFGKITFLLRSEHPESPKLSLTQARTLLSNEPPGWSVGPWGAWSLEELLSGSKGDSLELLRQESDLGLKASNCMSKDSENAYSVGWTRSPQGAKRLRKGVKGCFPGLTEAQLPCRALLICAIISTGAAWLSVIFSIGDIIMKMCIF